MPARSFNVVIPGGGNAGIGVTVATREAGLEVAMLEPDLLGGTCSNRGCIPNRCWSPPYMPSTRSSAPSPIRLRWTSRTPTGRRSSTAKGDDRRHSGFARGFDELRRRRGVHEPVCGFPTFSADIKSML